MNHNTSALLASFGAAPPVPGGSTERAAVDGVKRIAADALPDIPVKTLGDLLMHAVSFYDTIIDALREANPVLDWESLTTLAHNIIGVAGMELYTGTVLGETPEPGKE